MTRRIRKFHVVMSDEEWNKLQWIADNKGISKSMVARQTISQFYEVAHNRHAVCADGHFCFCPEQRKFPSVLPANEDAEEAQDEQGTLV